MGAMLRRRRPLLRGAAIAGGTAMAYHAGKSSQARADNEPAQYEQDAPADQQAAMPAQQQAAAAPPPAAAAEDPYEQIAKLAQLHDAGALTDEEFSAAKAKILGT
jgi:hypothetical protein